MAVRIGFVGTGGIAGAHFNTLSHIKDVQLVAFCDVDNARAENAARRFDGKSYNDARTMLNSEKLDAVYICLPPHAHKDAEILAAKAGCALFVEKPLSNNLKTATRIAQQVEDAGVITAVGYHYRYFAATEAMRQTLTAKKAPELAMASGYWLGGFPGVSWWRKIEESGGQMVEQTTHIVDLARYLGGEIVNVSCFAAQRVMHREYSDSTVPDATAMIAEFASGAVASFTTTAVLGGLGIVGLDLMTQNAHYELRSNTLTSKTQNGETRIQNFGNNPMLDEDTAFVQAVKSGKRAGIKSNYADALKTLAVTLAANQSAKTGKTVKVNA